MIELVVQLHDFVGKTDSQGVKGCVTVENADIIEVMHHSLSFFL